LSRFDKDDLTHGSFAVVPRKMVVEGTQKQAEKRKHILE
jgi:hypothetical protein